jgi:hypothetical protein
MFLIFNGISVLKGLNKLQWLDLAGNIVRPVDQQALKDALPNCYVQFN